MDYLPLSKLLKFIKVNSAVSLGKVLKTCQGLCYIVRGRKQGIEMEYYIRKLAAFGELSKKLCLENVQKGIKFRTRAKHGLYLAADRISSGVLPCHIQKIVLSFPVMKLSCQNGLQVGSFPSGSTLGTQTMSRGGQKDFWR